MAEARKPRQSQIVVQLETDDSVLPDERACNEALCLMPFDLTSEEREIWDRIAPDLALIDRLEGALRRHCFQVFPRYPTLGFFAGLLGTLARQGRGQSYFQRTIGSLAWVQMRALGGRSSVLDGYWLAVVRVCLSLSVHSIVYAINCFR